MTLRDKNMRKAGSDEQKITAQTPLKTDVPGTPFPEALFPNPDAPANPEPEQVWLDSVSAIRFAWIPEEPIRWVP
ncbi:MAG: hypothetical protein MZV63_63590 [Marinilabiliales bacterium]|nr:hypothetical protein [Marinilabiliales bacterium]